MTKRTFSIFFIVAAALFIGIAADAGIAEAAREINKEGRFIAYDDDTVLDTKTGLMWAAKDTKTDIDWYNAKNYCETFSEGNYSDWRMPTQSELAGLYEKKKSYRSPNDEDIHLTGLIQLSTCWVWSSDTDISEAAFFSFCNGERYWKFKFFNIDVRALPVRNVK